MRRWSAVIIGFIGVQVIVQPGSTSFSVGTLVALSAAVLSAIVAIQIKQLSRVDPADTIVFYTYVLWVPISLVPALFAWEWRSEEHTSELQSLMRISYAVFCLKKKNKIGA